MNDMGEISKHVGYDELVCNNDEDGQETFLWKYLI